VDATATPGLFAECLEEVKGVVAAMGGWGWGSGKIILLSIEVINVNPGLINPKRLLNWEGTIKKYHHDDFGGIPP
jgi:hypothetical protein